MRGPLAGCLMAALLVPAAFAQQEQQDEEPVVLPPPAAVVSPIPKARVIRPAEAEVSGQESGDEQASVPQPTFAATSDEETTTEPPGDASQVRVVYGSQPEQSGITSQTPTSEAPEDEDTAAADPRDPNWKQDRTRRFRRAPMRRERAGVEIAAPIVPLDTPETELMEGARLRQLDKMTGETETFDIAVGETRRVARLQIKLDACRAPDDNDTHGTMAFISIWDTRKLEADPGFTGWMFAESPALSALDHPRYDLWVISCTTSSGETSASRE